MFKLHSRVKARFLFCLLLGFLTVKSYAQDQFRLSDYKNPDYQWKQLELGVGLAGNNAYMYQKLEKSNIEDRFNSMNFSSDAEIRYYATKNSLHYQGFQDFMVSGGFMSNKNHSENVTDDLENTQKSSRQDAQFSAYTENRFYNNKKQFLEIDFDFDSYLGNQKLEFTNDENPLPYMTGGHIQKYQVEGTLPVMIGMGRIEEVQDARLAVYILDDLLKSGDLGRAPVRDEILAFAKFITETKNQRYFDNRIRKIAEITAIDSMLTVLNLKSRSGASYYTLLNDNWDYAEGPVRKAGSRFSAGLAPKVYYDFSKTVSDYQDTLYHPDLIEEYTEESRWRSMDWGMDFVAAYTWEKPASLYWQHTINAGAAYSLYYEDNSGKYYTMDTLTADQHIQTDSPNLNLFMDYRLGFYPNSRTELTLDLNTRWRQYWKITTTDDLEDMKVNDMQVSNELNLNCYYYISPQLRLTVTVQNYLNFHHNTFPDYDDSNVTENNFSTNFSAGLVYKIF